MPELLFYVMCVYDTHVWVATTHLGRHMFRRRLVPGHPCEIPCLPGHTPVLRGIMVFGDGTGAHHHGGYTLPWVLVAWVLVLRGIGPCPRAHGACVIPVLGTQMCTHAAACIDHGAAEDRNGNCLFHYLPFPSPSVF